MRSKTIKRHREEQSDVAIESNCAAASSQPLRLNVSNSGGWIAASPFGAPRDDGTGMSAAGKPVTGPFENFRLARLVRQAQEAALQVAALGQIRN